MDIEKHLPGGYTLRHAPTLAIAKAKKPRVQRKTLITLVSKGAIVVGGVGLS